MSVPSAIRILNLIEWLAAQSAAVSLTQASQALNLPKSSTLLLLKTLVEEGYAARDDDGGYRLTRLPGEPSPGNPAWGTLLRIAEPYLQKAVAEGRETGFIAVLTDEMRIHYLTKILPDKEIHYDRDISRDREPPHDVASGLAILSALPEDEFEAYLAGLPADAPDADRPDFIRDRIRTTRAEGYAVNLKGRVDGASGVAVPVLDLDGRPVAAVNLSGPTDRVVDKIDIIARAAMRAARDLSRELVRRAEAVRSIGAERR